MLKISRISRSIITVMYVALMCVIVFLASKSKIIYDIKAWQIIVYLLAVVFCVFFYQGLKRRLNIKIKSNILIQVYRYVYLAVVLITSRIIMIFCLKDVTTINVLGEEASLADRILNFVVQITGSEKYSAVIINTVLVYITSIVIKKIMQNLFNNDAIATTSSILYVLSPASLILCLENNPSIYNTLFILLGILFIINIHDQIVQYGLKNNRYIYLSIGLGVAVSLDILFGGSLLAWIILCAFLTIGSDYVDSIYLDVSKCNSLKKLLAKKKINKLVIKKSIVILAIVCIFGLITFIVALCTNLNDGSIFIKDNLMQSIYNMFGIVKWQYIVGSCIIILFEIMAIVMKRKNGAKTSLIQLAVIVFGAIAILYTNTQYNLCIYDALLSMSFILSVGNIYYNRVEKVKLLKEKN